MKLLIVCASALAYTLLCILGQIRIIRGFDAPIEAFPYQARIEITLTMGGVRHGGASLIAADWLLTAAHCVYGADNATVYLGTTSRSIDASSLILRTSKIFVHRYFNEKTLENDIALIKIPAVNFTVPIRIVKLPKMNAVNSDYVNEYGFASGWGRIGNSAPVSENLQISLLKVLSNKKCLENIISIQSGMLCAEGFDDKTPCAGDSGGPLVLTNNPTQVGIISWGSSKGCHGKFPVVFTRITHYLQWIKDIRDSYQ